MRTKLARWSRLTLGLAAASVLTVGALPARAQTSDEARLLSLTNQVRAASGLAPLSIDAQLTGVAQNWAGVLASRGVISHNQSLPSQVSGWKVLGENVGVGGTVDAVHAGFVASPTHYANLVDPAYTKVGFGIVRPDARVFVVEVFMQPSGAAAAAVAPAASSPPPTAAAAPEAPATTVTTAAPAPPAPAAAAATAPASATAAASQLSTWLVNSLDRLRSMEPAKAA